jgi:hypothetical protein
MPRRRRRGARVVAIEADGERGFAMRMLMHRPTDMLAGALAAAAIVAIITNALFLQAGRHPSPMFGSVITLPLPTSAVSSLRSRSLETATRPAELVLPETKPAENKISDLKSSDPMTNLVVKSTAGVPAAPSNIVRPPAPIPTSNQAAGSRRVAAVQRALTDYGYGQLKPTGTIGSDTQAAISKFERERKLPVTGQMSDRLMRELAAVIGHPVE